MGVDPAQPHGLTAKKIVQFMTLGRITLWPVNAAPLQLDSKDKVGRGNTCCSVLIS